MDRAISSLSGMKGALRRLRWVLQAHFPHTYLAHRVLSFPSRRSTLIIIRLTLSTRISCSKLPGSVTVHGECFECLTDLAMTRS